MVINTEGMSMIPPKVPPEVKTDITIHAAPPTIPIIVAMSIQYLSRRKSRFLRIHADPLSVVNNFFYDIFGGISHDDFFSGKHRDGQIRKAFHRFNHVRINKVIRPVETLDFYHILIISPPIRHHFDFNTLIQKLQALFSNLSNLFGFPEHPSNAKGKRTASARK